MEFRFDHKRHAPVEIAELPQNAPLILVALQRTVPSHDLLRGHCFTVNVLGAEQRDFALHFAGRPRPSLKPA